MIKVTVKFVFEGVTRESENEIGILIGDKVLLSEGEVGVYDVLATDNPDVFLVDLDNNGRDYYSEDASLVRLLL